MPGVPERAGISVRGASLKCRSGDLAMAGPSARRRRSAPVARPECYGRARRRFGPATGPSGIGPRPSSTSADVMLRGRRLPALTKIDAAVAVDLERRGEVLGSFPGLAAGDDLLTLRQGQLSNSHSPPR